MPRQYISLKISGTPVRKGGFIPMVNINEAFFEIIDSYPVMMSRDACVYTMCTQPDMTVYKLVFNRMRHHGDGSHARLVIGFSIPAGFMLAGGADATGVLHTLLEAFIGSFALALPDGTFEYRIGRFDTGVLEDICRTTRLAASDARRVVMRGDAPRGAIEAGAKSVGPTLACVDREEFAAISELIVAEHINPTAGGIGVMLKDELPKPEVADVAPHPAEAHDGDTREQQELSDNVVLSDNNVYSSSETEVNPVTAAPDLPTGNNGSSTRRWSWPTLLAGAVLGAVIAYFAFRVTDGPAEGAQEMITVSDTVVVTVPVDTLSTAKVETVFVEKKVVEVSPRTRRTSAKPPSGGATASGRDPGVEEMSAPPVESAPAPVYKYDPEAERSL